MHCENLKINNRTFRTLPGRLLLGSTGARLMVDYLDPQPGFTGRIDVIHKMNIPMLFSMHIEGDSPLRIPSESTWYPDRLSVKWSNEKYNLSEDKWITWDDQVVCCQKWYNHSKMPLIIQLNLPAESQCINDGFAWLWTSPVIIHGISPVFRIESSIKWNSGKLVLLPHESVEVILCAACTIENEEHLLQIKTSEIIKKNSNKLLKLQRDAYEDWFSQTPTFLCNNQLLQKCWEYRWYILRKNLSRPNFGYFHHIVMYEGRSHKMVKDIFKPSGWEFTKLVPLSTPFHINEMRWYHNLDIVHEMILSLVDSADENGMWRCLLTDERQASYANCSAYSLYQLWLCEGDITFIRKVLPAFRYNCISVFETHKSNNDHLQVEYVHQLTGKEYQPSYWYFAPSYPDKVSKITDDYTPLKRVDRSVYAYLDFIGLSHLYGAIGDRDEEMRFALLAKTICSDILEKMWDEETQFFYDLHYLDDRKAMVKNIVGLYPYWAGITDERHISGLKNAWNKDVFATGSAFASVSADCPVYSASGGWKGDYFKGRNGCVWNGPSWPYTTAIVLDAIAKQSRHHQHMYDDMFAKFLREYSLQHFTGQDLQKPYLVEHYDSITGEPLSDEADYNHSYYIDLIVRCVAGLIPTKTGFVFDPIDCGLDSFSLRNVRIRNCIVDIEFANEEYFININGKKIWHGYNKTDIDLTNY